jgi:uncharacterized protein YfdQ (DUF2303 family)
MNDSTNKTAGMAAPASAAPAAEHLHLDESVIRQIGALTLAATAVRSLGNAQHLVLPPEYKHVDLTTLIERAGPAPHRKQGSVHLGDVGSFIAYVRDQAMPLSCYIYADPDARTLTAVLNENSSADAQAAGWRDFRAVCKAELSREFDGWMKNNKKVMEQEDFAIFLEDNIADIVEPSGEAMMAVALTLEAKTEVSFSSARRLDNGQVQLSYSENIDARAAAGAVDIPREFAIGVRLFKNGDAYKVRARLKYRLASSKVKFWYELDRPENVIEDAFEGYIKQARESGYTVLLGKA